MADSRGLSRKAYWINHADEILARMEQLTHEVWVGTVDSATNYQSVFIPDADITITKVGFVTDYDATAGTVALVNQGTEGTGDSTIGSHGTLLLGTLMQTLTLTTLVSVSEGEKLVLKRTTAQAQETLASGLVHIEYTLGAIG